jgi:hypothetical protein
MSARPDRDDDGGPLVWMFIAALALLLMMMV